MEERDKVVIRPVKIKSGKQKKRAQGGGKIKTNQGKHISYKEEVTGLPAASLEGEVNGLMKQ